MNTSRKVFISKKRFKEALKARGFKVKDVCNKIGVPYDTLKYCLREQLIMPDILDSICKCLNVHPDYLRGKEMETLPSVDVFIVKGNDESLRQLNYLMPFVDSEGYTAPTYNIHTHSKNISELKDSLFSFISSCISSSNWSKEFFEENYDEIIDIFVPSINGMANYIKNKTGKLVLFKPLKDRKENFSFVVKKS